MSNTSKLRDFFGNNGYWAVNKSLVRYLDDTNAHIASIFFSELLDQSDYFEMKGELKNVDGEDGFFFMTMDKIEKRVFIKPKMQASLIKLLEKKGLIRSIVVGLPAKKHFKIEDDAFAILMKFSLPSQGKLDYLHKANYYEKHIDETIDFNKLKSFVDFDKSTSESELKNGLYEGDENPHKVESFEEDLKMVKSRAQKVYGVDKLTKEQLSDCVEEIYKLYPTKCPIKKSGTGKSYKHKSKIEKLINDLGFEAVKSVFIGYPLECRDEKIFIKNFGTFLNQFPDPENYTGAVKESEVFDTEKILTKSDWIEIIGELEPKEKVWMQRCSKMGSILDDPIYAPPKYAIMKMKESQFTYRFVKRGEGVPN